MMAPTRQAAIRRWAALALFVTTCAFVLAACGGLAAPSSTTSLRTVASFQGVGGSDTAHFTTGAPWVLAWTCNPYVAGVSAPFGLTITVNTSDNYIFGTQVLDTECTSGTSQGSVGVRQTGEQWLTVGTGGDAGPWTLVVEVTASDTSAALLPTPLPTPTSLPPTPVPTPLSLPFTFSGSGNQDTADARPFSTALSWNLRASCQGHPDYVADFNIYQFGLPGAISPSDGIQVGQLEVPCDGQIGDTNQDNPSGFPSGTFAIEVVSNGNWTITVHAA